MLVPLDHRIQRFDDVQRADPGILQGGAGGVAEPEPTDDDIEVGRGELGEAPTSRARPRPP